MTDYTEEAMDMLGQGYDQKIEDRSDLRKYRTELPNLYDDADLDPYEFRLLAHYKRVGTCTESSATTAEICHISKSTVSETRQRLADKGFIKLTKFIVPGGYAYSVEVVDVWLENFAKYSGLTVPQIVERLNRQGSPREPQGSPHRYKELTTTSPETPNVFRSYEENIGLITPMIADELKDAERNYPILWIVDSFKLAVKNNKRNWRYCETILKRWKADGKDSGEGKPKETFDAALAKAGYR